MKLDCVFLDMDGVISDFHKSVESLFPGIVPNPNGNNAEERLNISKSQMWKAINASGEKFWVDMIPFDHASELVKMCQSIAPVHILTSAGTCPYAPSGKLKWIQKHFPKLAKDMIITGRKELLAKPNRMLVDDTEKKILAFQANGGLIHHFKSFEDCVKHLGEFKCYSQPNN